MALATNSTPGEVHLNGDLIDTHDAYNPQLRPTGVIPGNYYGPNVVVDEKGRIINCSFNPCEAFGDASTSNKSCVQIGSNVDVASGVISVADADGTTTKGVIKSGDSALSITSGSLNIGSGYAQLNTRNVFTKRNNYQLENITSVASEFTPDFSASMLFKITMYENATLKTPTNSVIGDRFHVIIDTQGFTLSFDNSYKIASSPTTPVGISILTGICIATNTFYCILQNEFE